MMEFIEHSIGQRDMIGLWFLRTQSSLGKQDLHKISRFENL